MRFDEFTAYDAEYSTVNDGLLHEDDLTGPDRTLALGTDANGALVHVYKYRRSLHVVTYVAHPSRLVSHTEGTSLPMVVLRPSGFACPEYTDREFAVKMARRYMHLTFKAFDHDAPEFEPESFFMGPRADQYHAVGSRLTGS